MKQLLSMGSAARHSTRRSLLGRSMGRGLVGGLVGTLVMDVFGAGLFLALSGPPSLSFSVIGDAAAAFLSRIGLVIAGGAALGAALHYLIGPALGLLFSVAMVRPDGARPISRLKTIGLAILYVEIMSQPLLAAAAILLKMTEAQTVQWFGLSFVMHLIYGAVLGAVVYRKRFS